MLRIKALTALGASRSALLAGIEARSLPPLTRAYSDSEFSVHTPKAPKKHSRPHHAANKTHDFARRDQPRGGKRPASSNYHPSGSVRKERLLALAPLASDTGSLAPATRTELHSLQDAIASQDLASIWAAWERLDSGTEHLGRAEHREILRLSSSLPTGAENAAHSPLWKSRICDFATAASLTGDVDLITAWFRLLLAHGQLDGIVRIWQQVVRMRLACGPLREQAKVDQAGPPSQNEDWGGGAFVQLDVSTDGDKIDIHNLVCLVAFACTYTPSSWCIADLFDKIEIGTPFRLFFKHAQAKRLHDSLSILQLAAQPPPTTLHWEKVRATLWEIELARGLSSGSGGPQRIARLLGNLFALRQNDDVYAIFQTAMRACAPPSPWLLLDGASDTATVPAERVRWTESCWSVCLSNFIAAGHIEQAMDVWSRFQAMKLRPTARIWNALLDGYGRAKNHAAAVQTWSAAVKQTSTDPSVPDELMYTTMINVHFRAKKVEEAMALFSEMLANGERNGGRPRVPVETYNAVLNGLFLNRWHLQAQSLLEEMLSKGPAPNIGTINTFLRAHARVGDLQSLASTIRLADKLKLEPDVVTFTTILDALLRKGDESAVDAVTKTLGIMNSLGVQPNRITYTAMIKACLDGADAAPTELAAGTLLRDSSQRRREAASSNHVRIEAALELLDRMIAAKVAPSEVTYTALIGGAMQNPEAVEHAFATKSVPARYCAAPKPLQRLGESAETIKRWMKEAPDISLTLLLLEHMKVKALPPTSTTYRFLVEGLCSARADQASFNRSMDLIDDMLLRSSPPEATRPLGPFASAVLKGQQPKPAAMQALGNTTWIVIFSSLLDRLEYGPRDGTAVTACARALTTAIRLVRETGSLAGTDGGLSLSRLVERAASRIARVPQ